MAKSGSKSDLQAQLANSLLEALQRGDDEAAAQALEKALAGGLDGPTIYLRLLQPALEQIGVLWETGEALVAEEHRATVLARWLMDSLWDEFTPSRYRGDNDTLLAGGVRDEHHDLGLTMVAQFLRRDGWHVFDMGGNVPERDFALMAARLRPRACLLSATLPERLEGVRATIGQLVGQGVQVPVLVGGRVFRQDPTLAAAVGAEGTAVDAAEAVVRVHRLLGV